MQEEEMTNAFKKSVEFFLKEFNIASYEIEYDFIKSTSNDDSKFRAQLSTNVSGRMAKFTFDCGAEYNNIDEIYKTAFHEVMELLIINLYGGIRNDFILTIVPDLDQNERHVIIRTLENVVYPLFHDKLINTILSK